MRLPGWFLAVLSVSGLGALGGCASPGEGGGPASAFDISQLDRAPVPKFQARPIYPFEARRQNRRGEALVSFIVDPNGDVRDAAVVRATQPDFGAEAVAAVRRWKFVPGQKGGHAVATRMQLPIVFQLNPNPALPSAEALAEMLRAATQRVDLAAIDISKLDTIPVVTSQFPPEFPEELRKKNAGGEAVVDFIVDVKGDVRSAFVIRASHPEFGTAALAAVARWKFKPGMFGGRIVNTHMQVPIVFTLN